MTETTEVWCPVLYYEGNYEVSDHGRVRSLDRQVWRNSTRYKQPHLVTYAGRSVPQFLQANGYMSVVLWQGNKQRTVRVHRLVLEAFVGPCPVGMETLHGNGNRADNRLSNLRWGTSYENHLDRIRHGTSKQPHSEVCVRGHPLGGANLKPSALRRGRRSCLACSRALNCWPWFNSRNPGRDREQWLQARSDTNYAGIVEDSAC